MCRGLGLFNSTALVLAADQLATDTVGAQYEGISQLVPDDSEVIVLAGAELSGASRAYLASDLDRLIVKVRYECCDCAVLLVGDHVLGPSGVVGVELFNIEPAADPQAPMSI